MKKAKKTVRKVGSSVLIGVYMIMLIICAYLNSYNIKLDTSMVINIVMFIIVAIIFGWAIKKSFNPTYKIQQDLEWETKNINNTYETENCLLFEFYNKKDTSIFDQKDLKKAYESYKKEMQYLESQGTNGTKCDIEDYINRDLIDDIAKKNLINLVPGAMTGMGILGTFIGLSFGLQNFNTGTSEEIAASIAPLMDGIKVAFHTSVYGMVFSLFFNLIYKTRFEGVYNAVDDFIDTYHKYVSPDSDNDNISKIIAGQQQQTQSILNPIIINFQKLNDNIETMCSVQQEQVIPRMDALNNSFEMFAKLVGDNQMKGMEGLIDKFTTQTNAVMTESFQNLKESISQTCDMQEKNSEHMQEILTRVQGMTLNIQQINELSQKTVADMSGYVEKVENLQDVITENCKQFDERIENNTAFEDKIKSYVDTVEEYQKQCGQSTEQCAAELKHQIEIFEEIEKKIIEDVKMEMEAVMTNASKCNKQIADASTQQISSLEEGFRNLDVKIAEAADNVTGYIKNLIQGLGDASQGANYQLRAEIMKTLTEFNEEFTKNISDMTVELNRTVKEIGGASAELGTMGKEFNGQLKKNLTDSLEAFDKELANICEHLSGTLLNIQSTIGRVPGITGEAFKGMEKAISEVEVQMMDLVNQVSIVTSTVQNQTFEKDESLSLE